MKKITLLIISILTITTSYSQTYTTGLITFNSSYEGQVDVTSSTVTLTLKGPDDRWLGMGFNVNCMNNGNDAVMFDGSTLTDRYFIGIGVVPTSDGISNQDWSITSSSTNLGIRTIVATRDRDTGDSNDFVFPLSEGAINFIWAYKSSAGYNFSSHGNNRGSVAAGFVLGVEDFNTQFDFLISPNPVASVFDIDLPDGITRATVDIYDVFGKQIFTKEISKLNSKFDIESWDTGLYLLRVRSEKGVQTKQLIKQ